MLNEGLNLPELGVGADSRLAVELELGVPVFLQLERDELNPLGVGQRVILVKQLWPADFFGRLLQVELESIHIEVHTLEVGESYLQSIVDGSSGQDYLEAASQTNARYYFVGVHLVDGD